ncbi:6926_t:CDS:1, partial [Racocetra fulgida]
VAHLYGNQQDQEQSKLENAYTIEKGFIESSPDLFRFGKATDTAT